MLVEALGRAAALLALRPDGVGAEALLLAAAALVAVVLVVVLSGRAVAGPAVIAARGAAFFETRTALRCSDPAAAGHRRARAPGAGR